MTKVILFDIDGLVIVGRKKYFSERFAEERRLPTQKVAEFFLGKFKDCSFGKADLKEEIAPYLQQWNYEGTVDDFLSYWFQTESKKDEEVLKIIAALRLKGIKCYIATRQEKYRMQYIWETVGLSQYFDGFFCTCNIGYDKSEQKYWEVVSEKLNYAQPDEVMFFDDTQKHVDLAKSLGIQAYFYEGIDFLKSKVANLL